MTPETRAYVEQLVADAPPLTEQQRQLAAAVLRAHLPAAVSAPLSA